MNGYTFWVTVILALLGFAMVHPITSFAGDEPLSGAKKQVVFALIGLCAMLFLFCLDYHRLFCLSWCQLYTFSTVLLVAVSVPGRSPHGRTRRIRLDPVSFQPLELMKTTLVLFFAIYLANYYYSFLKMPKRVFWMMVAFGGIPAGLIAFQNLSTGLLLSAMVFLITLFGVKNNRMHLGLATAGAALFFLAVHYHKKFPFSHPYQTARTESQLNPDANANGNGSQVRLGKCAISTGGWFGAGFDRGAVKQNGLPEPSTDSISPVIGEELGMVGMSVLILLYAMLLFCILWIACHASDRYGVLFCGGATTHILLHIAMHVAMVTSLTPNTGVALPFTGDGGTSLVSFMGEIGLVLAVSGGMRSEQLT